MSNFWQKLHRPFLVLAPMENVTDFVFREIVALHLPKPDVFFTEFTSADGLMSKGFDKLLEKLKFSENQRPIVAQIWGVFPDNIYKSAKLIKEMGFDGVDINMGCPDKAVVKKGSGASLCLNPKLAKEIIVAAKEGALNLPVSVKTRLGFDKIITDEWVSFLLEQKINALTLHGRTALQMSKGKANWNEIEKAVLLRNKTSPHTVFVGNGDVKSYKQALQLSKVHGVDGIMIGRGIFNNPWVFDKKIENIKHTKDEYLSVLLKHLSVYETHYGKRRNYEVLKKFFKMYITHFRGANLLRQELMKTKNGGEARKILGMPQP